MTTEQENTESKPNNVPQILLLGVGAALNLTALFTDNNTGALVAIGCSLIAIGAARMQKKSD